MRACLLLVATVLLQAAHLCAATGDGWTVRYQPIRIVNGSPVIFRVTTPKPVANLAGNWLGREFAFSFDERTKTWSAIAGASLDTKPGSYTIQLHGETAAGRAVSFEEEIRVLRQRYPRVVLKVPGRYTAPSAEEKSEIEQDKKTKEEAFKTLSPHREWEGSFAAPVTARISDVFGVQRIFNGSVQSTHQGLDFRVPAGTTVAAVNGGRVILARSLFFEGNCVVIDHGQGLLDRK